MTTRLPLAPDLPDAAVEHDLTVEGRALEVAVPLRFGSAILRLRRMAGRWLATAIGPTGKVELAADGSPYVAAQLALEPWQVDAVSVMVAVGSLDLGLS